MQQDIYQFEVVTNQGEATSLEAFRGNKLIIVNTASECGFTKQYRGLEKLYRKYKDQGFVVLGFPCNQFGKQEPGSDQQIAKFCEEKYSISFPLFAKVEVSGENAHPLFRYLCEQAPGLMGTKAIKWNFTKFYVSEDGQTIQRFAPQETPEELEKKIF